MWWIHSNVSGTSRHVPLILQGLASCGDSTLLSQDPTLTAFLCFALFCCFFKLGSGHHRLLVLAQHCNQNLHVSPNWWVPSVLFGPCNTFFLLLGSSWLRNTESEDQRNGERSRMNKWEWKIQFPFFSFQKNKRGKVITVIAKVENQHFYPLNRHVTAMRLSNVCCAVILLPCDLVTGRKWAMCVDGLLQLLFFGSSAVAKLENKTKVIWSFPLTLSGSN